MVGKKAESRKQKAVLRRSRPAAVIEPLHAALQDLEHELNIRRGTIDNGEGIAAERGGHVAVGIASASGLLHDDGGRGRVEPAEQFEDARAGFFGCGRGRGRTGIEREAEINDRDVHGVGADGPLGLARGADTQRVHAHGLEQRGQAIDPRLVLPAAPGEEQVEAAAAIGGGEGIDWTARGHWPKSKLGPAVAGLAPRIAGMFV